MPATPRRFALRWVVPLAVLLSVPRLLADTAVGDGGHYLRYVPKVYLHNPDGRAFTVTVHLMRWPMAKWNPTSVTLRLSDPEGKAAVDGEIPFEKESKTFELPAGPKGAWLLEMNLPAKHVFHGPDFWVESSLDRAVVFTGNPHEPEVVGNAMAGRWLIVQCSVPRRWWFWVPPGTKSFTARTQWVQNYQSQREDWGITIFSPRGQRVRTLWGDLDMDRGRPFNTAESRTASTTVNVEPGAAGRFWCVELRFADSHNYSKISFSLEGVPPYLARSPEEWFDPAAAAAVPAVPVYDDDAFMQSALDERTKAAWPWLQNFSRARPWATPTGQRSAAMRSSQSGTPRTGRSSSASAPICRAKRPTASRSWPTSASLAPTAASCRTETSRSCTCTATTARPPRSPPPARAWPGSRSAARSAGWRSPTRRRRLC